MTILNTSVSGMLADSNWLSTISQNVANANTTGYKNQETDFSTVVDAVSSTSTGGGVTTSLRSLNSLQGNIVSATTSTNLAVQGRGSSPSPTRAATCTSRATARSWPTRPAIWSIAPATT